MSASSDSGVTISGPPSSLSRLRETPYLAKFQTAPLPIKTPYHTPHIFGESDITSILSTTSLAFWSTYHVATPAVSSANGDFIWADDFPSLLRAAVGDILIKPLRWDKIGQRLELIAGSTRGMPVVVHQIGISADRRTALLSTKVVAMHRSYWTRVGLRAHQTCLIHIPRSRGSWQMASRLIFQEQGLKSQRSRSSAFLADSQTRKIQNHSGSYFTRAAMSTKRYQPSTGMQRRMWIPRKRGKTRVLPHLGVARPPGAIRCKNFQHISTRSSLDRPCPAYRTVDGV